MPAKLRVWISRVFALFVRGRLNRKFDEELETHLSLLTEKFIREGMARNDASYAARRQFGGITQVRQERHESQSLPLLETLFQDLRLAIRMFLRSPGFTATVVLVLALGIGTNTAIFSVVNAVLLKPLNYPDPDRIVQFMLSTPGGPAVGGSAAELNIWRQQTSVFEDVSAYRLGTINLTGESDPEQLTLSQASATGFHLFGAPVVQGRTFTAEEDRPGGARVVVLSQRPVATPLRWRHARGWENDLARRRALHGDRNPGAWVRLRQRPSARRIHSISNRPQQRRSSPLFLCRGPPQARRDARHGECPASNCIRSIPPQVSKLREAWVVASASSAFRIVS